MSLPDTYKHAVFKEKGGPLVLEEVPLKLPGNGEILVKVEACGVCHSDVFAQYDAFGGGFPVVPGHEIIGRVAAVGDSVDPTWKAGDRIGAGWHGGHDGSCYACQYGWPQSCDNPVINGVNKQGGYSEYCLVKAQAAIHVPENVDAASNAPLICAGVTTFNALSSSGLQPGDTIAIQGLGGLGHLAIQFASKMGFKVVAVSRGPEKEADARKLGASEYIDASAGDPGQALRNLGGAKAALTTALSAEAMTPLIKGLNILGKLLILAIPGDVTINTYEMIKYGISVQVCPTGNAFDSEKTFEFAARHDVSSIVQTFPLDKAQEAYDAMVSGKAHYRSVIQF